MTALCLLLASNAPAAAQTRVLVADPEAGTGRHGALFAVDELGNRTTISDFGFSLQGPRGADPVYVAVQPGGLILVLDPGAGTKRRGTLFAVDGETGKRRIISDFGNPVEGPLGSWRGSEPAATAIAAGVVGLAVTADGRVLVGDTSGGAEGFFPSRIGLVFEVAADGTRSIFRDYRAPDGPGPSHVQSLAADPDGSVLVGFSDYRGPGQEGFGGYVERVVPDGSSATEVAFLELPSTRPLPGDDPLGLAVEASGKILATSPSDDRLVRIDPQSMTYQVLTIFDLSLFADDTQTPFGVAVAPGGGIFVTTRQAGGREGESIDGTGKPWLWRVDPATGASNLLSDFSNVAQGTKGIAPSGIAIMPSDSHPRAGDLVVVDFAAGTGGRGALFTVDPSTGGRTIFSDFGDPAQGPVGRDPYGVAIGRRGQIWVLDQLAGSDCGFGSGCGALFAVDPLTGRRTLRSDFGNAAQGPLGGRPYGLAIDGNGDILVADQGGWIVRIDARTGARAIVSSPGGRPSDVAVTGSGDLLVPNPNYSASPPILSLQRIPAGGGPATVLSDLLNPAQGLPLGEVPIAVHADATGRILVVDQVVEYAADRGFGILYDVDPTDGSRSVVTDFTDASQGPIGWNPSDVTVDASGNILVSDFDSGADEASGALFLVDAATGNRTFLSDFSDAGQGPTGVEPSGVAVFAGSGFPGVDVRDLAVTRIVPATAKLTAAKPSVTKSVTVQIQNRGTAPVAIADAARLRGLVDLRVTSLGACPAPAPALVVPPKLPIVLNSKAKLTLAYTLPLDCANDPAKTTKQDPGHDDFELSAQVKQQALGGADDHPADDVCPRSVTAPFEFEPFPDAKIKEKGCGAKKPDGTFGAPVTIDVVVD